MNLTLKPEFGLSGSALKVIAMISMVIDHVALYLMDDSTVLYETMRCIGRIAFPVFAFLIAVGFIHTRSRYRYFFTLLGFAVIWYLDFFGHLAWPDSLSGLEWIMSGEGFLLLLYFIFLMYMDTPSNIVEVCNFFAHLF